MTDQGPAIPASSAPRERRPLAGAALAALGVYLVLTVGQIVQTLVYALTTGYAGLILGSTIPTALAAALPFAVATWLGLGVILPVRAGQSTGTVVGRALVATLFGLLGALAVALVVTVGAYASSYLGAGYRVFSVDDLAMLAPRVLASAGQTVSALIVPGVLAVVLAAVLLRDALRTRAAR